MLLNILKVFQKDQNKNGRHFFQKYLYLCMKANNKALDLLGKMITFNPE